MSKRTVRTVLLALGWLGLAALIALGGAGIVASTNHAPGSVTRPELTWEGDASAGPALDDSTAELEQLAADMEAFGVSARLALAQVVAGSLDGLQQSIAIGTLELATVTRQAAALEASLGEVPGVGAGAELRVSPETRERYEALTGTTGLTAGLEADWAAFTNRAIDAAGLTTLLAEHDQRTAAAAKAGSAAHYKVALDALDRADATMAETLALRDRLAPTTDVSTLSIWLDRNATYDAALRNLYQSLVKADGRVTDAVRKAFAAERAARERLPGDTRGLVVIMADVAQGGLNQAVISIEEARGSIDAALATQQRLQEAPEPPG